MRVFITSGYGHWGSWSPADLYDPESSRMIGGGETAMVQLSAQLARRGHEVMLFYDCERPIRWRGVDFLPKSFQPDLITSLKGDVLISWEDFHPVGMRHTCDLAVLAFQCNAMSAGALDYSVDHYQAVSNWHVETLTRSDPSLLPRAGAKWLVVPNGVDLARYAKSPDRHPFRIIHSSSPDRGLHHLLRMWPDIKRALPEAELRIFYELNRFFALAEARPDLPTSPRARDIKRLLALHEGNGVQAMGPVGQWQLAQEQMAASLLVYPMDSIDKATEGFGITILEALAAGTPVITTSGDAFGELWAGVTRQFDLPVENKEDSWVRAIHYMLTNKEEWQMYSERGQEYAKRYSWNLIGESYATVIEEAYKQKMGKEAACASL